MKNISLESIHFGLHACDILHDTMVKQNEKIPILKGDPNSLAKKGIDGYNRRLSLMHLSKYFISYTTSKVTSPSRKLNDRKSSSTSFWHSSCYKNIKNLTFKL